jgi:hypothetical protein
MDFGKGGGTSSTGAGSGSGSGAVSGVGDFWGMEATALDLLIRFLDACSTLAAARAGSFRFLSIAKATNQSLQNA